MAFSVFIRVRQFLIAGQRRDAVSGDQNHERHLPRMHADERGSTERSIRRTRTTRVIEAMETRTPRGFIRGVSAFIRVRQLISGRDQNQERPLPRMDTDEHGSAPTIDPAVARPNSNDRAGKFRRIRGSIRA